MAVEEAVLVGLLAGVVLVAELEIWKEWAVVETSAE